MSDTSVLIHHLSPLQTLLEREGVTEVVVNTPGWVGVEDAKGWHWVEDERLTTDWLRRLALAAAAFTQQDVTESRPICSTELPQGERCQIVVPPAVPAGEISITIRKPCRLDLSLEDLDRGGLFGDVRGATADTNDLTPEDASLVDLHRQNKWPAFLRGAVRNRKNILVSGATGAGKTTISKALIPLIPAEERIVTIEDTRELVVPHKNRVHMLYAKDGAGRAQVGPKDLLESALRMRPDRVLLQELRDGTAFYYLRNVNSGHPGSITTLHANSAMLAFEQLTLLVKESEAGRDLTRDDIRELLFQLVDVVMQVHKVEGGGRQVTEIYFDPHRKLQSRH